MGEEFQYEIVKSQDGTAVGVRDLRGPDRYECLCMYDASTGEGWPGSKVRPDIRLSTSERIALQDRVCKRIENKLQSTGARSSK